MRLFFAPNWLLNPERTDQDLLADSGFVSACVFHDNIVTIFMD